ncbi:hypothetical protein CAL26_16410 [Bordetella genomosp. 9]|uniref:CoA-binding domain-containing protein n=1 Tax=Bordetella genomosp. 9 TaxID=1416803 RepID=A0A261R3N3_9BORD|nr:acetate--CoA ligase family protein [Bordetella genomosp. 9]OZI19230.1 hypothetical protein CAL26_16410 [Bordetella genomosp. 9]
MNDGANEPPVVDLSPLLTPASIAIVGASTDPNKIGAKPLKFLRKYGYGGAIHPVNPRGGVVDGLTCHTSVAEIDGPVDCAIVVTTAAHVLPALRDCAAKGVRAAVVISAGFAETGPQGMAAQAEMREIAAAGLRILGPNNQGTVNLGAATVVGFNPLLEALDGFRSGTIGLVSQSSGVGFGLMGLGLERGMGFAHLLTTGNEADLTFADCGLALLEREEVQVVAGAIEGIRDPATLRRLARRSHELGKPVVILKGATSKAGMRAAASHTGALAGHGAVFSAFCRQEGLIEADSVDALLDYAQAFASPRSRKTGTRTVAITGTGGTAVLMADALEREQFELPAPGAASIEKLRGTLPDIASLANPIDMTTANLGNRALFTDTARIVGAEGSYDTLIAVVGPAVAQSGLDYARQIVASADYLPSTVVTWTAPDGPGQDLLRANGILVIPSPQRLAAAMSGLRRFNEYGARRSAAAAALPDASAERRRKARDFLSQVATRQLAEHQARTLCAIWDLPFPRQTLAHDIDTAEAAAREIGFPVALKLQSAQIGHKTEIGGVVLNLKDADSVRAAAERLLNTAGLADDVKIDGVLVQEMVIGAGEVIVGGVKDPELGMAIMAGPGGTLAEVMQDVSFRLAPFDAREAECLCNETRLAALVHGVRGRPAWDAPALYRTIERIALMASELEDLVDEIDFNPLIVRRDGEGVVIVDALVVKI